MQSNLLSLSPSFNSYSSSKLAATVDEFSEDLASEFDNTFGFKNEEKSSDRTQEQLRVKEEEELKNREDDEDDDFEFPSVCREPDSSPISADEIFYNGQIKPFFPLFDRDLLFGDAESGNVSCAKPPTPSSIRIPLRKLLLEDRDPPSCSSSEADDLEGIPPGTYCVWTPKSAAAGAESSPQGRCKKSNSMGSSKRWKFRDLLHRSNSDGKETFVFRTPSNGSARKKETKAAEKAATEKSTGKVNAKIVSGEGVSMTAAHEAHYVKNRAVKDEDHRRRSFLPYRQDLVGFFANVNGLSRNVHPF